MFNAKPRSANVLDFFHSENQNVHVIHCTTTSFESTLLESRPSAFALEEPAKSA